MTDHPCPKCGGANPPEARFCRHCRTYLRAVPATSPAATAAPSSAPPAAVEPTETHDDGTVPLAQWSRAASGPSAPTVDPAPVVPREPEPVVPPVIAPVAPAEASPRTTAATAPIDVPQREPGPNELRCPACSHINEVSRRFCGHCGEALQDLTAPAAASSAVPAEDRSFGTVVKKAAHRGEYAYDRSLALRSRLFRVGAVLALCGIGVSMLPPWGSGVRNAIGDRVSGLFPKHYAAIADVTADARGDSLKLKGVDVQGFEAAKAIDGQPDTAWLSPWTAAAPLAQPRAVCENSPATQRLLVRFPAPTSVDRVTINAVSTDSNVANFVYPARVVDLCFGGSSDKRITLDPSKPQQSFGLHVADVRQVTVVIANVGIRAKSNADIPSAASIAEIAFEHQK